eukprot:CAMPEP_0184287878 /NCGR_PEP_ID=MMETSP1049-20130417/269_1 /TAXON_ID=77928 /ORGANISM="Proteomonas sulcata, Strain CCMP704" /LENGTH=74 /DNA_ID=CAMNT_0026593985 /DNA_START=319 /DNA_END=540 /DNA_ORIENTATION=+
MMILPASSPQSPSLWLLIASSTLGTRSSSALQPLSPLLIATSQQEMFSLLFDLEDYATTYRATRDAYLKAANEL